MRNPRRAHSRSRACAKPIIGMMNGLAYGGAAVLASSLDIRIGCERSRFRSCCSLWADQRTWSLAARSAGRGQGTAVYRPHRRSRGGLSHRAPQSPGPQAAAAREDHGDREHDRGQPSRRREGGQGAAARAEGGKPGARWAAEHRYTTQVMRGAKAKDAFPEFLARKGISAS